MVQSAPKPLGSPDFLERLGEVAGQVETRLSELIAVASGRQAIIMEAARYAALGGGKRLRPFLVYETTRMLSGPLDIALSTGRALECLHVYSLIHDDLPCMDDDDMRRGKPTVHIAYDTAIATLAGDGLLTYAFEILADPKTSPDAQTRLDLISGLAKAGGVHGMIGGQVIDITVAESERDESLIMELQDLKTGALIEYGVLAGAIFGQATPAQYDALRQYAAQMGLAFQIKDDILDTEGDAEIVGKAVGKDADLGKATFVSILGLEGARKRASNLGEKAKASLQIFGSKADILCDTVDFVLNRDR